MTTPTTVPPTPGAPAATRAEQMTYARMRALLTPDQVTDMEADLEHVHLLGDEEAVDVLFKWACAAQDNVHAALAAHVERVVRFLEDRSVLDTLDPEDITGVHTDPDGPRRSLTVSDLTAITVALGARRPVPMTRQRVDSDRSLYTVDGSHHYLLARAETDLYQVYDLGTGTDYTDLLDPTGEARSKAEALGLIRADARAQRP